MTFVYVFNNNNLFRAKFERAAKSERMFGLIASAILMNSDVLKALKEKTLPYVGPGEKYL